MKFTSGKILAVAIAAATTSAAFAGDSQGTQSEMQSSVEAEMRVMDSNKDGKISAAEHSAGAQQMFQSMDGNQDSRVTPVEMDAAQKTLKAADASHGRENGKGTAEMSSIDKIKVVDKNGDGVLAAKEHEEGSKKMFSKMDADKDGFLTAAEITAGHAKMMTAEER